MRTRLVKNIVLEKKKTYEISLTLAWRLYFLETLIKKITKSRFSGNIFFGGPLIDQMIYGGEYSDTLEIYLENVALNKFNISRLFKDILFDLKWKVDDIKLISDAHTRKYKVDLLCYEKDWEQVISVIIMERVKDFPKTIITRFKGIYYDNFLIRTYCIEDLISSCFIKFIFFNNIKDLDKISMIYKKIIINEMELKQSLKKIDLAFKLNLSNDELRNKMDEIKGDLKLQDIWKKNHDESWEEVMILVEGIIKLL